MIFPIFLTDHRSVEFTMEFGEQSVDVDYRLYDDGTREFDLSPTDYGPTDPQIELIHAAADKVIAWLDNGD